VPDADPRIRFVTDLGRALHGLGVPAHRLESALGNAADRLGIRAEFLSTPTSLISSFGPPGEQHITLARVHPGQLQLDKLVELDEVVESLYRAETTVHEAEARVREVIAAPSIYPAWLGVLAFALTAASACRFFGGGLAEMGTALVLGLFAGGFGLLADRFESVGRVYVFTVATFVTFMAVSASQIVPMALSSGEVIIATLIILLPGLTLTLALNELASGHLVAGTARLTGASMTFLLIGLGVGLGRKLAELIFGTLVAADPVTLPGWTLWAALAVTPAALGVLFRARVRELPWIIVGSALAFWCARAGVVALGPGLGTVAGAVAAGLAGNLYARWQRRPAVVVVVPSIILLVPGAIGYQSLNSMMAKDVMSGVDTAFMALLVGVSLVAGLLLANVLVPSRNAL